MPNGVDDKGGGYSVAVELMGKVALVTGGGSGIGQATAWAFARSKAAVVVSGRHLDRLAKTVSVIEERGGTAVAVEADVRRAQDVERLVARCVDVYGRLDYAFNNAGVLGPLQPLIDLDEAAFTEVMDVNVRGVWLSMKYEVAQMLKQGSGGGIVNNSSLSGILATPGGAFYNASKHAVLGLTKCAAVEYIRYGIRVNAVCPGSIATGMLDQFMGVGTRTEAEVAARRQAFLDGIPIGRFGIPSEAAEAVVWLCSEQASFIVGQSVVVDGGATIM